MTEPNNDTNRTHEPSLRELTADLDGHRKWTEARLDGLISLINERDRRYEEAKVSNKQAVDAAFDAAKEAVGAALTSAKEAVAEAKRGQDEYNKLHNDLQRKQELLIKETLSRTEADQRFGQVLDKINDLRESRSGGMGRAAGSAATWATIALGISLVATVLGMLSYFATH
jgi:hypothetical protein